MNGRPVLDKNLDSKTFRDFYYLKEELVLLQEIQPACFRREVRNIRQNCIFS